MILSRLEFLHCCSCIQALPLAPPRLRLVKLYCPLVAFSGYFGLSTRDWFHAGRGVRPCGQKQAQGFDRPVGIEPLVGNKAPAPVGVIPSNCSIFLSEADYHLVF